MKMKRSIIIASLILATLLPPAYSANVTVIAEGIFDEYVDPDGLLPFSEPAPGTVFRLQFTYDSVTPDSAPLAGFLGLYESIPDITLTIGSDTFGRGEESSILILNDVEDEGIGSAGYLDIWEASTRTGTPTGTPDQTLTEGFALFLASFSPAPPVPPLTSDNLVEPPWPSSWDIDLISYSIRLITPGNTESLARAAANVTSITVVPLPAAAWLLGSALGLLGWMSRRITGPE